MTPDLWAGFPLDPRRPEHATLRASDADRDLVQQVLAEAYADGRLDASEHDERSTAVASARTLGELPPMVADLVPERALVASGHGDLADATPGDLRERAHARWESARRQAVLGLVGPTLICWAIWAAISLSSGGFDPIFPWPLIVMAATGVNLIRTLASKQEIIADRVAKLERQQAKALKARKPRRAD